MERRLLSFALGIGLLAGTAEAQLQRIVLQGAGAPQVFTDINAALAAAQPNDKMYLSGGSFSSATAITLSMPLHFIGAGIGPDSAAVTSTTTLATTSGDIMITTGASGSTFTGIRFSPSAYFQYGTNDTDDDPTGLVFERCTFDSRLYLNNSSTGASSSTTFNECVLHSYLYGAAGTTAMLTRCILDAQAGTGAEVSGFGGGGLSMRFCVCMGTRIGNSSNCLIENSIFTRTSAPFWQSTGATLTNNLLVSTDLVSNMTGQVATGNVLGIAATAIFVSEDNTDFEWSDDLHLQAGSAGLGMATDGTQVGIFGSNSPFKAGAVPFNPHFRQASIAPATNASGDLPVNIRVAAQSH